MKTAILFVTLLAVGALGVVTYGGSQLRPETQTLTMRCLRRGRQEYRPSAGDVAALENIYADV